MVPGGELLENGRDPRVEAVVQYVDEHMEEPIGLREAAGRACMHPAAFSRFFAQKTGITFNEFLRTARIERALHYLETCDRTLNDIASRCGFGSTCSFFRAFRRVVGCSPSVFRSRNRPLPGRARNR